MSLIKIAKIINSNMQASKAFRKERWNRGFGCVKCGSIKVWKHRKLKNGLQKYQCQDCKHIFSDQSTTVLRYNKLKINKIAVVNHLSKTDKLSCKDISLEAEISLKSTFKLKKKIRIFHSKVYQQLKPKQLSGIVEADETYFNGKWYFGMIERDTNRAIVQYIPDRSSFTLEKRIWSNLEEYSTIITDEWKGYMLHPKYFQHFRVNHSKYFVHPKFRAIHTNRIEGLWAQLKRRINRFYNGVKSENIQDYINQILLKNYSQTKNLTFFPLCSHIS